MIHFRRPGDTQVKTLGCPSAVSKHMLQVIANATFYPREKGEITENNLSLILLSDPLDEINTQTAPL